MLLGFALVGAVAVAAPQAAGGQESSLRLGAPFADHAVLQRDMPLPVWGWATPGTQVSVGFAGQEKSAQADANGKWMLSLDPLPASFTPGTMRFQSAGAVPETLVITNVLVGEVWLASGQSNMQWPVAKTTSRDLVVDLRDGVVPIREFQVRSVTAQLHPIEKATGVWRNGDYGSYSAIAYAFAHSLYTHLDVPIGILNGSFSQTSIQAWVPRVGFRDGSDAYTRKIYQKILETDPETPEHQSAWSRYYQDLEAGLAENVARQARGESAIEVEASRPGNLNGNRDASWLFNGRIHPLVPYALRGAIWNQGYANMGEGIVYYHNLHSLIRGWRLVWNRPDLPVYFHQFYAARPQSLPSLESTAEMRLGTLMARDIPFTGMASQIDVGGSVHYSQKAIPGQRLALHALKNQYGADVVADGPIFKSYAVKGNKLIVTFDHADGGLMVGQLPPDSVTGPQWIENGEAQVELFYLAGADRVWHRARMALDGDKVVVTSAAVPEPRGVTYGTGGVSFQPNLYNKALLPMSPFMVYEHEVVRAETWPDAPLKIAGHQPNESMFGESFDYRRMPLLSTQFRDRAVLQAGVPVRIWGGLGVDSWRAARYKGEIRFRFGPMQGPVATQIEKTIAVEPGMEDWEVILPPMQAGPQPYSLHVAFLKQGEVVHERQIDDIVFGDVFYVAAPAGVKFDIRAFNPSPDAIVRVIERNAKRDRHDVESRYSIAVSTAPGTRFAAVWQAGDRGVAGALGHRIAARTGKPVGIIWMQSGTAALSLASWIPIEGLKMAPSLLQDYRILSYRFPWSEAYAASVRQSIADLKSYWESYIPAMIATKSVPDGRGWGSIPSRRPVVAGTSDAARTWNVMGSSFSPVSLRGVIFLTAESYVSEGQGRDFGAELSALANSWQARFGSPEAPFVYTIPSKVLAADVVPPASIKGSSTAVEIESWESLDEVIDAVVDLL